MRIIDLSMPINTNMQVFPGDSTPEIISERAHGQEYMVTSIKLGSHTGTHIDAPLHAIKDAKGLGDLKLDAYIGEALVMDFHDAVPKSILCIDKIRKNLAEHKNIDRIILRTDWHRRCANSTELDLFADYPALDMETANMLVEHGIKLIGLESPSVSATDHVNIHQCLLAADVVIVENLINVASIRKNIIDLHAVPLSLTGIDGSPVRAYAIER